MSIIINHDNKNLINNPLKNKTNMNFNFTTVFSVVEEYSK
jgi:hypothetical protein